MKTAGSDLNYNKDEYYLPAEPGQKQTKIKGNTLCIPKVHRVFVLQENAFQK